MSGTRGDVGGERAWPSSRTRGTCVGVIILSILNAVPATQGTNDEMSMLGQRVQALRKQHRLSQERLASMAGTSPSQISLVENGKSKPSLKTAVAIARALDTSLDFLTGAAEDRRKVTRLQWELGKQSALLVDLQAEIQKRTGEPLDRLRQANPGQTSSESPKSTQPPVQGTVADTRRGPSYRANQVPFALAAPRGTAATNVPHHGRDRRVHGAHAA